MVCTFAKDAIEEWKEPKEDRHMNLVVLRSLLNVTFSCGQRTAKGESGRASQADRPLSLLGEDSQGPLLDHLASNSRMPRRDQN